MMAKGRGFGIAGALEVELAARLAEAAEAAGYASFWANDTPNGEGLASLAAAAKRTKKIKLGVGVIPIDRQPAALIAKRVSELGLPEDRLVLGIGSGGLTRDTVETTAQQAEELGRLTSAKVVIGALGPKMCEAAGSSSDGVLLNWLTAEYVPT